MAIKSETITSWEALASAAAKPSLTGTKVQIYRGVTNAAHELVPKVGRSGCFKTGYSKGAELQLLLEFHRKSAQFLSPRKENNAISGESLFMAQHHGLPTRLLDWSESMLVAAFFAVDGGNEDLEAAIYSWTQEAYAKTTAEWPLVDNESVTLIAPPHISPRIAAQHSIFTQHNNPAAAWDTDGLVKYMIPRGLRLSLKVALYSVGFSRASLFPGLDGLAESLWWREQRPDVPAAKAAPEN